MLLMDKDKHFIDPERLTPGIYIDLELSWTQHPFIFSKFKISTWDDVRQIQKLGLEKVRFFPHKSDTEINLDELVWQEEKTEPVKTDTLWEQKKISIDKAQKYRTERKKAASKYEETKHQISVLVTDLKTAPANAIRDASSVIDEMAVLFKNQQNMMINLVNLTGSSYSFHNHSLNVTVLALALGKHLNLSEQELHDLGVGCILHDIGKVMLPQQLLMKSKLTAAEKKAVLDHVGHGLKMLSRLEMVRPTAKCRPLKVMHR